MVAGCFRPINPQKSKWFEKWDAIMVANLTVLVYTLPYEVAFLTPQFDALLVMNTAMNLFFCADMVLQFFIQVPDPDHPSRWVDDPATIRRLYLKNDFMMDLISLTPVDLIMLSMENSNGNIMVLKMLRFFRLVRLLRMSRVSKLARRWSIHFGTRFALVTLLTFFIATVICLHLIACFWGWLGISFPAGDHEHTWLTAVQAAKGGHDSQYTTPWSVYSMSLYWAIMTLTSVGYGDIIPQNNREYWACSFCMVFMAIIWVYVIGETCNIVANLDQHDTWYKRTMDELNDFMEDKNLPHELRISMRAYFQESESMKRDVRSQRIVDQLSPKLQSEVTVVLLAKLAQNVWFLSKANIELTVEISKRLQSLLFAPDEPIVRRDAMFVVQRGMCARNGRILTQGSVWGEDMVLNNFRLLYIDSARSLTYLMVQMLTRESLEDAMIMLPSLVPHVRLVQVRLSIRRGIVKLSRALKQRITEENIKWNDLEEDARLELITEIGKRELFTTTDFMGLATDSEARQKYGGTLMVTRDALQEQLAPSLTGMKSHREDASVQAKLGKIEKQLEVIMSKMGTGSDFAS